MTQRLIAFSLTLLFAGVSYAAAPKPEDDLPPRIDAAITKGLGFLARQQGTDGAFEPGGPRVATASLTLLAFLSTGNAPDLGKYGLTVRGATEWLLGQQSPDGYFGAGDHGMYAHAITTLALAEAYGLEGNPARRLRIHHALEKATSIIITAQAAPKSNPVYVGGWRYERNSADSDLSLSGWNVLALRAAQDAGIIVPDQVRARALDFVLHCWDESAKGFAYQPGNGAQPGDTAIGLLCLSLLDATNAHSAKADGALKYLQSHPIDENGAFAYYATFYVAQASYQQRGDSYAKLGRAAFERLVRLQEKDGGWSVPKNSQEPGRVYAAAMAVQTLAIPSRLLPVYQR